MNGSSLTLPMPDILAAQRSAFMRVGAPSLKDRAADLRKLRRAMPKRRGDIEAAVQTGFGHRSKHETAIMELLALKTGIDHLHHNLRSLMRAARRRLAATFRLGSEPFLHNSHDKGPARSGSLGHTIYARAWGTSRARAPRLP